MIDHTIASRDEWQAARDELLAREKEHTRLGDELARERRELPWVLVEKDYRFQTDDGERSLAELFEGRSQLLIYHFMFGPSYQAGCPINSSIADSIDGVVPHLRARDATLILVSQAPIEKLQAYKRRMGWSIPWVSASITDFNFDLGFSQTAEQARADGRAGQPPRPVARRRVPAGRREQCPQLRHGHRGLPDREPGVQHVRPGRRRCVPGVPDDLARPGVRHGLLPDPRSRTERPRRGTGRLAALDPTARRVRGRLTRGWWPVRPYWSATAPGRSARPPTRSGRSSHPSTRMTSPGATSPRACR